MSRIKILKEGVDRSSIDPSDLTTDCYYVTMTDGTVDIVRAQQMVKIFDEYYAAGKKIQAIEFSGGRRNPKITDPTI